MILQVSTLGWGLLGRTSGCRWAHAWVSRQPRARRVALPLEDVAGARNGV